MTLLILWAAVGVTLLYLGASDTLLWQSDPDFRSVGLNWTDSSLPHGIVALLIAAGLLIKHRLSLWEALVCAIAFGLYYLAYLLFGGEGALYLRVVVPILLLALVIATFRLLRSAIKTEKAKGSN